MTGAPKSSQKKLISGVKPTGRPHIGNYFGAMKQFVEHQDAHQSFIFIADLHALTSIQNAKEMLQNTLDLAIDYLAIGLDPAKVVLFKQSDVPEHAELCWIFNCITTMPYLMRAHAFKDAEAKSKEINVGIFDYPILMSADILLYDIDVVPVGQDQKQHVEYARDIAEKFNRIFAEGKENGVFKLPQPMILKEVAVVPGTDGQKMSKSYGNTIGLFAEHDEIKKGVMSIPTGSEKLGEPIDPDKCKVFALHKLFASEAELADLRTQYTSGKIGYKGSKDILVERIETFIKPLREKRAQIAKDPAVVHATLKAGASTAKKIAEEKMKKVRKAIGTSL